MESKTGEQTTLARNTQAGSQEPSFDSSKTDHQLAIASVLPVAADPASK